MGLATSVALGLFGEPVIQHTTGHGVGAGQLKLGGVVLPAIAAFLRDGDRLAQLLGGKPAGGSNFTVVVNDGLVLVHGHPIADHERAREGPHIAHAVLGAEGVQTGFFVDFTGNSLLEVLARVDEPGNKCETVGVPLAVIGQEHALAVAAHDQAHDGRFDAGKDHFAGGGAADSLGAEGRLLATVGGVAHVDEVVAACQGGGVVGAAFRVLVDRVVAEATAGGAHPRIIQVGGGLREGFVLAVEHMHLHPAILLCGILLGVRTVGSGTDDAAGKDRLFGQRLGSITTGQVVQGPVIVEEGFPFARNEQITRRVSVSGCVFR